MEFVVGLDNGSIATITRGDRRLGALTPNQRGPINALALIYNPTVPAIDDVAAETVYRIACAGVNGFIKILDAELQVVQSYNLYIPVLTPGRFDHGLLPS
jgi:hypothetical protein